MYFNRFSNLCLASLYPVIAEILLNVWIDFMSFAQTIAERIQEMDFNRFSDLGGSFVNY